MKMQCRHCKKIFECSGHNKAMSKSCITAALLDAKDDLAKCICDMCWLFGVLSYSIINIETSASDLYNKAKGCKLVVHEMTIKEFKEKLIACSVSKTL